MSHRQINQQTDRQTNRWAHRRMDRRTDGWVNRQTTKKHHASSHHRKIYDGFNMKNEIS